MRYQIFDENTWLYPDSEIMQQSQNITLEAARNAATCFQILTDLQLDESATFEFTADVPTGIQLTACQMLPIYVQENSGPASLTTLDYESVKDFVTRKAPFEVYEIARRITDGKLQAGRTVLLFYVATEYDMNPGEYRFTLQIAINGEETAIPVSCKVYKAQVPKYEDTDFEITNWISLKNLEDYYNAKQWTPEFCHVLRNMFLRQKEIRSNAIMLPCGKAVKDASGNIVDFDFSEMIRYGQIAKEAGMRFFTTHCVAHWKYQKDGLFITIPNIGEEINILSTRAYEILSAYFKKMWNIVKEQGWAEFCTISLADEPSAKNAQDYRILAGIARKVIPGVRIVDAIETPDLCGAIDNWCAKQVVYEKYLNEFQALQAIGEKVSLYTCGFPAGKAMRRCTDLTLLSGRLMFWMCRKYRVAGHLHYGFISCGDDPLRLSCFTQHSSSGAVRLLPPGDANIAFPDGVDDLWFSIRGYLQRIGAEDFELLRMLSDEQADALIARVARTFYDYTDDTELFAAVHHELLEAVSAE